MPVIQHTLEELLDDAYAFCYNQHMDGWRYRVESEGWDPVMQDCHVSAKEFVKQLEEAFKEKYSVKD